MREVFSIIIVCCCCFVWWFPDGNHCYQEGQQRSFSIDFENDTFLMDGRPFRYVSGSMHYMRVPPELWMDRMKKIQAAGFNTLQFFVQWNLHEPTPGNFKFEGRLDIDAYLDMAHSLGLYIIFRPGPYTCGERDGGGLPFWLYQLHPEIEMRTKDPTFLQYVDLWWAKLLPRIERHLYKNGGPIILVQMENEYGSYGLQTGNCDIEYMSHLVSLSRKHLGDDVVLFTTDGAGADMVRCGQVPGAYATVDFGIGSDVAKAFAVQRLFEQRGPLVNSEFYPGWFDSWGHKHGTVSLNDSVKTLNEMLEAGANVNVYMAHGGTSFGFESGANASPFLPQVTSYDYDALVTESGDLTEKYFAFKEVIAKYVKHEVPLISEAREKKAHYGTVNLRFVSTFFDSSLLKPVTNATDPLTFEQLGQDSGFVLYETTIDKLFSDPSQLTIGELHDRAYVFINREPRGVLSRGEQAVQSMPVSVRVGDQLQLLVENQGRIGYGPNMKDFKGIIGSVTLGGTALKEWSMFGMPLDDGKKLDKYVRTVLKAEKMNPNMGKELFRGLEETGGQASFWTGELDIPCDDNETKDTFLELPGWSKGVVFVNGFNLGRYWPIMGPQVTLYVPAPLLKCQQRNTIVLFELEKPGCDAGSGVCFVKFVDIPQIDGQTPFNIVQRQKMNFKFGLSCQ